MLSGSRGKLAKEKKSEKNRAKQMINTESGFVIRQTRQTWGLRRRYEDQRMH